MSCPPSPPANAQVSLVCARQEHKQQLWTARQFAVHTCYVYGVVDINSVPAPRVLQCSPCCPAARPNSQLVNWARKLRQDLNAGVLSEPAGPLSWRVAQRIRL